jgi:putative Mn2+ efflux pump MntP
MIRIILLALSVSIDSWAVGDAYRAEQIHIPFLTKLIVAMISLITSLVAVCLGNVLGNYVDTMYIQIAGGAFLLFIGGKSLWNVWQKRNEKNFDKNASKTIEPWEGIVFGGVLAGDSFSAGLSLCGMKWNTIPLQVYLFPAAVGGFTFLFLLLSGRQIRCFKGCNFLSGGLVAALGAFQIVSAWI